MPDTEVVNDPSQGNLTGPRIGIDPPSALAPDAAIPRPMSPGMGALPEKMEKLQQEEETQFHDYEKRRNEQFGKVRQAEAQEMQAARQIPKTYLQGPPPDWKDYQKRSMGWAGAMAMFGALAAKGGRQHGTAALSAFNGALKGWQEGNLENYTKATEQWRDANKAAIQNNEQLMKRYQMVLDNARLNIDQQRAELERIAIEEHDNLAFNQLRAGNMTTFAQLQDTRWENQHGPKGIIETYKALEATNNTQDEFWRGEALKLVPFGGDFSNATDKNGQPWTNEQKQLARTIWSKYAPQDSSLLAGGGGNVASRLAQTGRGPQDIDRIASAIASGRQPPILTGLYGAAPAVRSALEAKGVDLAKLQIEWEQAKKQVSTLNSPQMTRFVGLGRSVVNTIDEVRDLSKQMQFGGIPAVNAAQLFQYIKTEGNSPNGQLAAKYLGAVNTLKEEFANLAQGGYAPTEPVWKLANQQINADYGVKELGASLDEIQRLINFRLNAIPGLSTIGPGMPNRYMGTAPQESGGGGGWGKATVVGE